MFAGENAFPSLPGLRGENLFVKIIVRLKIETSL